MTLTVDSALRKDRRNAKDSRLGGILQHRHFAVIAGIVAQIEDDDERARTAQRFADALRGTNPRFDRMRFLLACNPFATPDPHLTGQDAIDAGHDHARDLRKHEG